MAKPDERDPLRTGIFGIVAGGLPGADRRSATPGCRSGRRARTTTAYFTDAGGITPGNDVNVSGIKVGKVRSVDLAGDSPR